MNSNSKSIESDGVKRIPGTQIHDLIGKKYGRLEVLSFAGRLTKNNGAHWLCLCECGNRKVISSTSIKSGLTQSCGCLRSESVSIAQHTHGSSNRLEYRLWVAMRARCYYKKHAGFHRYGGRGIRVCEALRKSFVTFIDMMGQRPGVGFSVDRCSVNGHYSCGSCDECKSNGWPMNMRWSTVRTQQNNRANNRNVTIRGITRTLSQWVWLAGISNAAFTKRLNKGMDPYEALTRPVNTNRIRHTEIPKATPEKVWIS